MKRQNHKIAATEAGADPVERLATLADELSQAAHSLATVDERLRARFSSMKATALAECPDDPLALFAERNRLIDRFNCRDDGDDDDLDRAIKIEEVILSAEPVTPQIVEAQFSVIARLVNEGFSLDSGPMAECLRRLKEYCKGPVAALNSEMLKTPLGSIADVVSKLEMVASILEDDGDDSLVPALRQAAAFLDAN